MAKTVGTKDNWIPEGKDVSTGRYGTYSATQSARAEFLRLTQSQIQEKIQKLRNGTSTINTYSKALELLERFESYGGDKETAGTLAKELNEAHER